jgi:HlyD family secretion protein
MKLQDPPGMNYETPLPNTVSASPASEPAEWAHIDGSRTRRRNLAIAVVVALILLSAGSWYFIGAQPAGEPTEKGAGGPAGNAPSVTVIVPGRQLVETTINATGSLAARREMPVGVVGEGGQVIRVLVEPGQWVAAGQILATVDRQVQVQQLAQLEASIRVAQADANLAQSELNRANALVERGFISRADIERRTAQRDSAAARVRVAQAQLAEARARTSRLDIRAPAAGLVLTRTVEPGQVVGVGSGILFRIARGGEMDMLAQMSEADIARVRVGARVQVTPVGATRSVSGQVWQLSPVVDPQSRQGTVRIAVPYSAGIRPGGFAQAVLIAGTGTVPLLPESAVQSDDQGDFVYVVGADNKVERRSVTVGVVNNDGVPILTGLTGTEQIVRNAGAFLNPGDLITPVRVRPEGAGRPARPAPPTASSAE